LAAALAAVTVAAGPSPAAETAPSEYEVKAAFLYNFGKFVEWPSATLRAREEPFILGVVGEDPFGDALERTVKDKSLHGKRLEVRRFRSIDRLATCHILFVSASEAASLPRLMKTLEGAPVLTVSDMRGFLEGGGGIRLVMERRSVRFAINRRATDRAGLRVSSQLLKLAQSVRY
jgi:hypothetical protein